MKYIHTFNSQREHDEGYVRLYRDPWVAYVRGSSSSPSYSKIGGINFNGHDYVDLDLPSGTLWATKNVGASGHTGYGNYYAYGDITTKNTYDLSTYRFGSKPYTKYTYLDGITELELVDDVVHVVMGGDWYMPSKEQLEELVNFTDSEYASTDPATGNNASGIVFRSRVDSSKWLYFPRGGYAETSGSWRAKGSTLYLRCSTCKLKTSAEDNMVVYGLTAGKSLFDVFYKNIDSISVYSGLSVRGVINGA